MSSYYIYHRCITSLTLGELLNFRLLDGTTLNVAELISTKYYQFGIQLLLDTTGARVSALEHTHMRNALNINCAILQGWLEGGGVPVSWKELVKVLRTVRLNTLADSISQVKCNSTTGKHDKRSILAHSQSPL